VSVDLNIGAASARLANVVPPTAAAGGADRVADAGQSAGGSRGTGERKLAAVLHADVAGYSRLMGEDESGTHRRLMDHRGALETILTGHGGRIVGTAGDAVLAEFASVTAALRAAVESQKALAQRNAGLAADRRLDFRIGIHLGDVIVDGNDIFGHGVNVAARVEALADPGGIAISASVHDQVGETPGLAFEDRGTHRVKNIAQPVRVFAVTPEGMRAARAAVGRAGLAGRTLGVGLAVVALGLAAVWLWTGPGALTGRDAGAPGGTTGPAESAALGQPVLAVLPFADRGGEPGEAYFSDGLTEDVIAGLGRFSGLLVLSWSAVAPYHGEAVDPGRLGDELGADYAVSGSVRRAGDRIRVTVQLTGVGDGMLLWSERYDREFAEIFAVQDEIARQVVGALAVKVTRLEGERAVSAPTENLTAYDRVLRGRELLHRLERDANNQSRELFTSAIGIDSRYADAYVGLAWTHMDDFKYGWTEWPQRALDRAEELAVEAIRLDDDNAAAHALYSDVLRFARRFEQAEREILRALELNPNNALSHAIHGCLLVWWGKPEPAIEALETALRLDPYPHPWWLVNLAHAYYFIGRYEDVIALYQSYGSPAGEDPGLHAVLAATHGQLGNAEEARNALDRLERVSPFFNARLYAGNFAGEEHGRLLLEGLAKAGLD
jgi:class 3 adenylate cyclase/TolB-like protein/Flp pilus assembly protein TadD